MRRLLFLDDNPDRHIAFDIIIGGIECHVDHVWTADECIYALSQNEPYDCAFLDHDLGGKVFVKEEKGSGSEVAKFIGSELSVDRHPRQIVVHSWNPKGAERMLGYIEPSGIPTNYVPFKFP